MGLFIMIKKFIALGFVAAFLPICGFAQENKSPEWKLAIGVGALHMPSYLGAKTMKTSVVPDFRLSYGDRFTASIFNGIRYNFMPDGALDAGALAVYNFGRKGDAGSELNGLGNISGTFGIGGYVSYNLPRFETKLELTRGVAGGDRGIKGSAEMRYKGILSPSRNPVYYSIGPRVKFGDNTYNNRYFDVSAAQSAASGISQFDASGGINSVGLSLRLLYPVNEKVTVLGFTNYDRLTGDVARSSIVTEKGSKNQFSAGLLFLYEIF